MQIQKQKPKIYLACLDFLSKTIQKANALVKYLPKFHITYFLKRLLCMSKALQQYNCQKNLLEQLEQI
ncbi:17189_t:CDS:2, partial [Gigaspora margarita]